MGGFLCTILTPVLEGGLFTKYSPNQIVMASQHEQTVESLKQLIESKEQQIGKNEFDLQNLHSRIKTIEGEIRQLMIQHGDKEIQKKKMKKILDYKKEIQTLEVTHEENMKKAAQFKRLLKHQEELEEREKQNQIVKNLKLTADEVDAKLDHIEDGEQDMVELLQTYDQRSPPVVFEMDDEERQAIEDGLAELSVTLSPMRVPLEKSEEEILVHSKVGMDLQSLVKDLDHTVVVHQSSKV